MVPIGSPFYEQNSQIRQELEKDIVEYKKYGIVIVTGDFNSRIGNLFSITSENKLYHRDNIDTQQNHNGRELVKLMNALGMIIISGIRQKTKFTCIKEMKGKMRRSGVDHFCIQEGLMDTIVEEETKEDIIAVIKTDHAMVVITIKIRVLTKEEKKRKQPVIRNKKKEKSISDLLTDDKIEFYKNMKELEDDMNNSFFYDD